MRESERWLLWKEIPNDNPDKKPRKIPYYTNGQNRSGTLDSPADIANLDSYNNAKAKLDSGNYAGLGFALGKDGDKFWQGIDLDDIDNNDLHEVCAALTQGYVETSPSKKGMHVIGYGDQVETLGSNSSGIEFYCTGRYFTFTDNKIYDTEIIDLSQFHPQLKKIHSNDKPLTNTQDVVVNDLEDLRSALACLNADDRKRWIDFAYALKQIEGGKELWFEWSKKSHKYDEKDSIDTWHKHQPKGLMNVASIYYHALANGWVGWKYWDDIIPLNTELKPVLKFDPAVLPNGFADWIVDETERLGCPMDFIAIPAMLSLASVIGNKVSIHPHEFNNWRVVPNLWGAIIGRPSTRKSPAISVATLQLYRLAANAKNILDEEAKQFEINSDFDKLQTNANKALITKAMKDEDLELVAQFKQAAIDADKAQAPTERRYIVNDTTVEKLGELLNENPNGLMVLRDELTGWLKTIEREDRSNDKAFYLEAFNGNGSYTYDRIARGTLHIDQVTVSICGGLQPSKLSHYIYQALSGGEGDDGLLQRFQLLVYPDAGLPESVDRKPDAHAKEMVMALFNKVNLFFSIDEAIHFTGKAQIKYNQWRDELNIRTFDAEHPAIASHLSKYQSLMPSLALIINEIDVGHGESVTLESTDKAIGWCVYLESHMHRIYDSALDRAVDDAGLILKRAKDLSPGFNASDIKRKNWAGLNTVSLITQALDELVDCNYLRHLNTRTGMSGRPSVSYYWNPSVLIK
jgi:putative DNA primase/helicase